MANILDDKSVHCIPFILQQLKAHQQACSEHRSVSPFYIGLNGVQGAGKTTLVRTLESTLQNPPHSLPTAVLSIDDLYLPRFAQVQLAQANPLNPLIQHRGQPSTHDVSLGMKVFSSLSAGLPTKIPHYDKSQFQGQGDRVAEEYWRTVNKSEDSKMQVVIFEGWCVGFRPLQEDDVRKKWDAAVKEKELGGYVGRLGCNRLEDVMFINEALRGYDELTNQLDSLIHIDAEDTQYVYQWRLEQEASLRAAKGMGMTESQVIDFVNGYYPAYELYTDHLRAGVFGGRSGRQLRLIIGRDRKVKDVLQI